MCSATISPTSAKRAAGAGFHRNSTRRASRCPAISANSSRGSRTRSVGRPARWWDATRRASTGRPKRTSREVRTGRFRAAPIMVTSASRTWRLSRPRGLIRTSAPAGRSITRRGPRRRKALCRLRPRRVHPPSSGIAVRFAGRPSQRFARSWGFRSRSRVVRGQAGVDSHQVASREPVQSEIWWQSDRDRDDGRSGISSWWGAAAVTELRYSKHT